MISGCYVQDVTIGNESSRACYDAGRVITVRVFTHVHEGGKLS